MYMNLAAGRRRRAGGAGSVVLPPANITPPSVEVTNIDTVIYVAGVWSGAGITSDARIFVAGADVGPAVPGAIGIQEGWRGQPFRITESVTNSAGTGEQDSNTETIPTRLTNSAPPLIVLNGVTSITYTAGTWVGGPASVSGRLIVNGVDVGQAAFGVNPVQPAWRGQDVLVRERATGFWEAPTLDSNTVAVPPLTLDEQVEAILAGTTGFVLDPQDLSTMSQVIAGTTPVTADGQPVGRFASKWGTVSEVWTSLNDGASRPVLGSGGLLYDGVDDFLQNSPNDIFRNVPAMFVCMRMAMSDIGGLSERTILTFSNTTTGSIRFVPRTTAGLGLILRSAGPGAETQANSATGLLVSNDPMVLSFLADYATGGRNRVWLDGTQVADIASVAAGGPTLDQDSAIGRIMRASTASFPGFGKIGRMVFCPFVPTDPQRAVLEAWVASGPFDPPPAPPPPLVAEDWRLPTDVTSLPATGELREHNGQVWRNISAVGNLWEPGILGWEAVE